MACVVVLCLIVVHSLAIYFPLPKRNFAAYCHTQYTVCALLSVMYSLAISAHLRAGAIRAQPCCLLISVCISWLFAFISSYANCFTALLFSRRVFAIIALLFVKFSLILLVSNMHSYSTKLIASTALLFLEDLRYYSLAICKIFL